MSYKITVKKTETIETALKLIDENSKGAIIVVNADDSLLALLTDGDLRRVILDGFSIDEPLSVLNLDKETIVINESVVSSKALTIMDEHEIDHLVVLSNDEKVVDLLLRKDVLPILLSTPHMGHDELKYVGEAFETNWIAPLGPNVDAFEQEIADYVGVKHAAALSSGTAAIHLSLILLGVKPDDYVICSSLTFAASSNPILYEKAIPVFVDSEQDTWNMCPESLEMAIKHCISQGKKPKAIIVVNLYGQSADMDKLIELANFYEIPIIEDAAESLGAKYKNQYSGTFGLMGIYSFNGNKIITTSGGGMLVSNNKELIDKARFLATQARDAAPYYQHTEIGYNYRMSNVLAGIGRGQLNVLEQRVIARRDIYQNYVTGLAEFEGIIWPAELTGYYSNHWLSACIINPDVVAMTPKEFIQKLQKKNIEARHTWKPMHLQPLYEYCNYFSADEKDFAKYVFDNGVCLPSGSNMTSLQQARVIEEISNIFS